MRYHIHIVKNNDVFFAFCIPIDRPSTDTRSIMAPARGICQNPELASSIVNTFAPSSRTSVSPFTIWPSVLARIWIFFPKKGFIEFFSTWVCINDVYNYVGVNLEDNLDR